MRKLILIPLAAAICMSMSGCPKIHISIDRGNEPESNRAEIITDSRLEFQGEGGEMINGYVSDGNGNMVVVVRPTDPSKEPQTTTGQTQPPSESTTPSSNAQLVGTWSSVSRQGNYLIPHTIEFKADGIFYEYTSEYTHTSYDPQLFQGYAPGWEPLPMGFPGWYGTYTVSGNTVTMVTLGDDVGSITSPETNTLTIGSVGGQSAVFNGQTYLKNFSPSNSDLYIEELCAALGVDLSV